MKYVINQNIITGLYTSTLLGGEFDNCHGQGSTPREALASLKMVIRIRRKNNK